MLHRGETELVLVFLINEGTSISFVGFSVGVVDSKRFKDTNLLCWDDLQVQVFHMCIVSIRYFFATYHTSNTTASVATFLLNVNFSELFYS